MHAYCPPSAVGFRISPPISFHVVVRKAGSNCCERDREEIEEATAGPAAAKEVSVDAVANWISAWSALNVIEALCKHLPRFFFFLSPSPLLLMGSFPDESLRQMQRFQETFQVMYPFLAEMFLILVILATLFKIKHQPYSSESYQYGAMYGCPSMATQSSESTHVGFEHSIQWLSIVSRKHKTPPQRCETQQGRVPNMEPRADSGGTEITRSPPYDFLFLRVFTPKRGAGLMWPPAPSPSLARNKRSLAPEHQLTHVVS